MENSDTQIPVVTVPSRRDLRRLSPREIEVLEQVAMGLTTKEAAEKLRLSHKTVDCHRTKIMEKLGVHNVVELVHRAICWGVIVLEEKTPEDSDNKSQSLAGDATQPLHVYR